MAGHDFSREAIREILLLVASLEISNPANSCIDLSRSKFGGTGFIERSHQEKYFS
jgi:hypothetical protein